MPTTINDDNNNNNEIKQEIKSSGVRITPFFSKNKNVFDSITWNKRNIELKHHKTNEIIFKQDNVEAPEFWSDVAVTIAASKYFRRAGVPNDAGCETSIKQLITRVVSSITHYGISKNYFRDEKSANNFKSDLCWLLVYQKGAFNSPVWFNVGLFDAYNIKGKGGSHWYWDDKKNKPIKTRNDYERPQGSACFIMDVEDDLEDIFRQSSDEAKLFKFGSGIGTNLSTLRSKYEVLSGGGHSSGVMSYIKHFDSGAGTVRSGGICLAPNQRVYTESGPIPVKDLVDKEFIVLSYDPPAKRFKAKKATAFHGGYKEVVRITTDKGVFETSYDHPFKLSTNNFIKAEDLLGKSLFNCNIRNNCGYQTVSLKSGKRESRRVHKLILEDVYNKDLSNLVVHHIDENKFNNDYKNLEILNQSHHAKLHNTNYVENNNHHFQHNKYPKVGANNPMHKSSSFWKDNDKVNSYKDKQRDILIKSGRSSEMAQKSTTSRHLNDGYKLINAGYDISTLENYKNARIIESKSSTFEYRLEKVIKKLTTRFGSYDNYYKQLQDNNHRVLKVEKIGKLPVYDVEVFCPTEDDKSPNTGHNFVIWSDENHFGSGVVVANTRRAAALRCLNMDHPEIEDFIEWKSKEEKKALALIAQGYESDFNGEAYKTVAGQNTNVSVRITDEFMEAYENNSSWDTKLITTGQKHKTHKARDLFKKIANCAWECADPGIQFDDTMNNWNTCADTTRINSTNPCIIGESLLATDNGLYQIKDIIGKTNIVVCGDDNQYHIAENIIKTGNKEVYRIKTKYGYELYATKDHLISTTIDGDVAVKDLQIGNHKIKLQGSIFGNQTMNVKLAEALGLALGDGCISNSKEWNSRTITWTMSKEEKPILEDIGPSIQNYKEKFINNNINVIPKIRPTSSALSHTTKEVVAFFDKYAILDKKANNKALRPITFSYNKKTISAILRGLFTADGTVANYSTKNQHIRLSSTSLKLLQQVQLLLLSFNIKSKIRGNYKKDTKQLLPDGKGGHKYYNVLPGYNLEISKQSRIIFENEINFHTLSEKRKKLKLLNESISTYSDIFEDVVDEITLIGNRDVYDLTEPETNHFTANGMVVHNCSEYLGPDNSACNLASIDVAKFLTDDMKFDTKSLQRAARLFTIAQDILVDLGSYPTDKICSNTHNYRSIGLGLCNLGSLLMLCGLPYDSEQSRVLSSYITAYITGIAYKTSSDLSKELEPFSEFKNNLSSMKNILQKHENEIIKLGYKSHLCLFDNLVQETNSIWENLDSQSFRNSQVTVIAPTGTISFLMDCATTGVEPDFSLVKFKTLAGGGELKIINSSIPLALKHLQYTDEQISEIKSYILEMGTIENAPHVDKIHYPIFDCSSKSINGDRIIHYDGHINMMAALQPFISGAISKTINVPNNATIDDIEEIFYSAWKKGLKGITVYRDGSKGSQPLNTSSVKKEVNTLWGEQKKLPQKRPGWTLESRLSGHKLFMTTGEYPDGTLGELFISSYKSGSSFRSMLDAFCIAVSLGISYGVPLEKYVDKFKYTSFNPSGFTNHKDIKTTTSILDFVFKVLEREYLNKEIDSNGDNINQKIEQSSMVTELIGESCNICGCATKISGACRVCTSCGNTTGCG